MDILQKVLEFIIKISSKFLTYEQYAQVVLRVARLFFKDLVEFARPLVYDEQKVIDEVIASGADEAVVDQAKAEAGARVDTAIKNEFSASPTWIPRFVRVQVRDAWAYLAAYGDNPDDRNRRAQEHGFFRQPTKEEAEAAIEALNRGFGHGK